MAGEKKKMKLKNFALKQVHWLPIIVSLLHLLLASS